MAHKTIDLEAPLEGVIYEKKAGIAHIRLNRPERGNSLTPPMQAIFKAIKIKTTEYNYNTVISAKRLTHSAGTFVGRKCDIFLHGRIFRGEIESWDDENGLWLLRWPEGQITVKSLASAVDKRIPTGWER